MYMLVILGALLIIFGASLSISSKSKKHQQSQNRSAQPGDLLGRDLWFDRAAGIGTWYIDEFCQRLVPKLLLHLKQVIPEHPGLAVCAIIAWETGWLSDPGSRLRVREYNNVLGIEQPGGGAWQFPSVDSCFDRLGKMVSNMSIYSEARKACSTGDARSYLRGLFAEGRGYNTHSSWLVGVLSCYETIVQRVK